MIWLWIDSLYDDIVKVLKKYFSEIQLDKIENAFETDCWDNNELLKLSAKNRIIYIMKNIIKNKGIFKLK